MQRLFSSVFGLFGLVALGSLGCSLDASDDRPPVADIADTNEVASARPTTTDSRGACEPGEVRSCKVFIKEENTGRLNCFIREQSCKRDGSGWLECGVYE